MSNKYPYIQEGDKVKFIHMQEPNIYQASAFSFITKIPKELDIMSKIDYSQQYEKSFLEPLRVITDKLQWILKNDEAGSLEGFF